MEPMALGSPPSSPASPNTNPNFLPAFLMGDTQPSSPTPTLSPGRTRNSFKSNVNTEPLSLRQKLFNQSVSDNTFTQTPYKHVVIDKVRPPKQGLFDTIDPKKPSSPLMNSTMQNYTDSPSFLQNDSVSRIPNDSINFSHNLNESLNCSNFNLDTSTSGSETLWVTVLGFPPSAASVVFAQFSNCGLIVDKKFPTQGNWVHLKYNSKHELAKALAYNGRIISNGIMVGVVPYHIKQDKENLVRPVYTSPIRARSLRQSFASPQNSNMVLPPQNVPQKSTGIVTKAMEYVFGW